MREHNRPPRTAIALFTRDLRLSDNPMLAGAAAADRVLPLFVLDDTILARVPASSVRLRFLHEALADVDERLRALGARLVVRRGDVVREVCRAAEAVDAAEVHIAADVTGYAALREAALEDELARQRRVLVRHHEVHTVHAPGAIVPAGRGHFTVFTPYFRRWLEEPRRAAAKLPERLRMPDADLGDDGLPEAPRTDGPALFPGGESAARHRAGQWFVEDLDDYAEIHDDLAADRTSRLSPYLHFGCVSAHELATRAEQHGGAGAEAFVRQLAWRDFHHQILAAVPEAAREDFRPRGHAWREDPPAFEAWSEGRTGIPIVDAGMRQLLAEGWMPNRARLITSSFLSKTLGLDWRAGAAHFAAHLVDADVADNVMNWQWMAGTGADTRPDRVLNPLRQAERYDTDGTYVRRHVPELAGIGGSAVHRPWKLGATELRRLGYPEPLVELEAARNRPSSPGGGSGEQETLW